MASHDDNPEEVRELLKKFFLTHDHSDSLLDEMVKISVLNKVKKNVYIWKKGDPFRFIAFVEDGLVQIGKPTSDGGHSILALIGPKDICGLSAYYKKTPYPADAKVVSEHASVLKIYLGTISEHLSPNDMRTLNECLKEYLLAHEHVLREKIDIATSKTVNEKVFLILKHFVFRFGSNTQKDSYFIPFPISKTQIAHYAEVRVETAIRLLGKWQKQKLLSFSKKGILISSLKDLEDQVLA